MAASIMLRKIGSSACSPQRCRGQRSRSGSTLPRVPRLGAVRERDQGIAARTCSSIVTASGANGTSLFAAVVVAASWIIC